MIEVKNLFHSYEKNDEHAVNDISFDIKKGEIFELPSRRLLDPILRQGVDPHCRW